MEDPNNPTPVHSAPSSAIRHSRNPSLGLEAISVSSHGHVPLTKGGAHLSIAGHHHQQPLDRHTSSQWSVPFSNDSFLTSAATTITSESFALTHQGSSWWAPQTSVVFQGNNSPRGPGGFFPTPHGGHSHYSGSPSPSAMHRSPARGFAPAAVPLEAIPSITFERGDGMHYPTMSPRTSSSLRETPGSGPQDLVSTTLVSHPHVREDSEDGSGGWGGGMELASTNMFIATATYVDDQRGVRGDASPTPVPSRQHGWSPGASPNPFSTNSNNINQLPHAHAAAHALPHSTSAHFAQHRNHAHADPSTAFQQQAQIPQPNGAQFSRRNRASTMMPSANRTERPPSPGPALQASQTMPSFPPSLGQEDSLSYVTSFGVFEPSITVTPSAVPASATGGSILVKASSMLSRPTEKTVLRHAPPAPVVQAASAPSATVGPLTFADTILRDLQSIRQQVDEHAGFLLHHAVHRSHRSAHALEPLSKATEVSDKPMGGMRQQPLQAPAAAAHSAFRQSLSAMPSSSFAGQLHLSACELLRHGYHDIHHQAQPLAPRTQSLSPQHARGAYAAASSATVPMVMPQVVLGGGFVSQAPHARVGVPVASAPPTAGPRSLLPPFNVATAIGGGLHSPEAAVLRRTAGMLLIDAAWWMYHETIGFDENTANGDGSATKSQGGVDGQHRRSPMGSTHSLHGGNDEGAAHAARNEIEMCLPAALWGSEPARRILSVSSLMEELGRRLVDTAAGKAAVPNEEDVASQSCVGGPANERSVTLAAETTRQYSMAQDVLFALAAQIPPLLASLEHLFLSRRTCHVAHVLMQRALLCIDERAALRRKRARMYDALEEGQGLVGDITEHLGVLEELRNNNLQIISDLCAALRDVTSVPPMLPNVWDSAPRMLQSSHAIAATHLTAAALRGNPPPHAISQKLRHLASTWHTLCGRRLNAACDDAAATNAACKQPPLVPSAPLASSAPQHYVLIIVAFPELQQVPVSVMSVMLQFLADAAGLPPPRHFICESHSYCGLWVPDVLALAWATVVRSGSKSVFLRGYTIPQLILPFWRMLDALRLVLYLPSFHELTEGGRHVALPGTCVQPTAVSNFWQMHLSSRGGTSNLTLVANAIGAMVGARPEYVEHVGPSQALNVWVPLAGRDGWMQFGEGQVAFVDVASGELLALDASPASLMPTCAPGLHVPLHHHHANSSAHTAAHHAAAAAAANGGFEVLMVARKRNRTRCGKETKKKGRPDEVRSATAV